MTGKQKLYLLLAVIGAVAPWVGFARFFTIEGPGGDFIGALFANGASTGFTIDLVVSSVVFWIFLFSETAEGRIRRPWVFVVVNLLIGLSCALPLALSYRSGSGESRSDADVPTGG